MFQCCDSGYVVGDLDEEAGTLDLHESPAALNMLFHLLHNTPEPYVPAPESLDVHEDYIHIRQTVPVSAIPFPLLPSLFSLADKYALIRSIVDICHSHLLAYAST